MPIQPIKIPQNVYIEDRIVGPLTLKQILIVGVGVGFSYALYGMLTKAYGALPLPITIVVWIPAGIAAMFAFIRINDISMFRLLLLSIERLNKPSTRVWSPRRGITINIRTFATPETEGKYKAGDARVDANTVQFDELSVILDRSIKKGPEDPEVPGDTEDFIVPPPQEVVDEPQPEAEPASYSPRPVDPSRVSAPLTSIFRDISPHS